MASGKMDKQIQNLLFCVLRFALWGETSECSISSEDFSKLMNCAKEQTLIGLVFEGLLKLKQEDVDIPRKTLLKWLATADKIRKRNIRMNSDLASFVAQCKDNNIDIVIVKGQTVGCFYPQPLLRQSGDIDFLVKDNYDFVRGKIEKMMGVTLPGYMLEKEVEFQCNGIIYELHKTLVRFGSNKNQQYWDNLTDETWADVRYVNIEGADIPTLPPTINVAYIFIHLYIHLIREGVALRQLCDLAVMLHAHADEIERDKLAEILEKLDMQKAFLAFGAIMVDELGLPATDFPFEISDDNRKWKKKLLEDIFRGGNFGKLNHKAKKGWHLKLETAHFVLRNSFRYYSLAPTETILQIKKLVKGNIRIFFHIKNP